MKCKICGANAGKIFDGKIMGKYPVEYFFCPRCEHLQTSSPVWLEEAYKTPIAPEDTGILRRNMNNAVTVSSIIFCFFEKDIKILDWAGGYGLFVRMMRDIGFDFVWDDKYTQNLFARGFEYNKGDKLGLVTAFEVMEHLEFPMEELEKIFEISNEFLFTQTVMPLPPPKPGAWWYYAQNSGQHISFYTNKTLDFIAEKFGKKHFWAGEFHLFTPRNLNKEAFKNAVLNDTQIYAENISKLVSKIGDDMDYIIGLHAKENKKPG